MNEFNPISPEIIEATERELQRDPIAKKIDELNKVINQEKLKLFGLEVELSTVKNSRPEVVIKWRESVKWCLEIDSKNPDYFLKSTAGVYKCIAFKHKIDITADIKNKIATTLSSLFKEKELIGRIEYNNTFYYGVKGFFKDNLEELKDEYKGDLEKLI